jgi:hypothetical protein
MPVQEDIWIITITTETPAEASQAETGAEII